MIGSMTIEPLVSASRVTLLMVQLAGALQYAFVPAVMAWPPPSIVVLNTRVRLGADGSSEIISHDPPLALLQRLLLEQSPKLRQENVAACDQGYQAVDVQLTKAAV